jgi:hypothetical protein
MVIEPLTFLPLMKKVGVELPLERLGVLPAYRFDT